MGLPGCPCLQPSRIPSRWTLDYDPPAAIIADPHGLPFVHCQPLRVRAARHDAHHLVARLPRAHAGTDRRDGAGELHARRLALLGERVGVEAKSLQQVGAVERRRRYVDQHLLGAGHRLGHVDDVQHVGLSVA